MNKPMYKRNSVRDRTLQNRINHYTYLKNELKYSAPVPSEMKKRGARFSTKPRGNNKHIDALQVYANSKKQNDNGKLAKQRIQNTLMYMKKILGPLPIELEKKIANTVIENNLKKRSKRSSM